MRMTKLHGDERGADRAWVGHWSKEKRRRRKANKVAKAARKVNRGGG